MYIYTTTPNPHLEDAPEPERPTDRIIQRPRETRLPHPVLLAPPRLQLFSALPVPAPTPPLPLPLSDSLKTPLRALGETGLDLAAGQAGVPVLGGGDAAGPRGVELVAEDAGLAGGVHRPEVGGLEGALVAERLRWQWDNEAGLAKRTVCGTGTGRVPSWV